MDDCSGSIGPALPSGHGKIFHFTHTKIQNERDPKSEKVYRNFDTDTQMTQ